MTLNSVVLPAPLGPIRPFTAPAWTCRLTSWSACSPPKRTEISSTASSANRTHLLSDRPGDGGGAQLVDDLHCAAMATLPEIRHLGVQPADAVGVPADSHDP